MPKPKILWLDDLERSITVYKKIAEANGYEVEPCYTLHRFNDLFENNKNVIKLIIIDIMLPAITDLSDVGKITEFDSYPILVLTGRQISGQLRERMDEIKARRKVLTEVMYKGPVSIDGEENSIDKFKKILKSL